MTFNDILAAMQLRAKSDSQPFYVDTPQQVGFGDYQNGAALGWGGGQFGAGAGLGGYALRVGASLPTKSLGFEYSTPGAQGDYNGYASLDPERMAQVRKNTPKRKQVGPFWMGPQER